MEEEHSELKTRILEEYRQATITHSFLFSKYAAEEDEQKKQKLSLDLEKSEKIREDLKALVDLEDYFHANEILSTESVGFQYFAKRLLEVAQTQDLSVEVFDFQRYWWDSKEGTICKKLYVRDCYRILFEKMEEHRSQGPGIFILSGTPGIGKSGFGLYAIIRLIKQGHLVWYKMKGSGSVVFVISEDGRKRMNQVMTPRLYKVGQVYLMKPEDESKLSSIKEIVRVHDPQSGVPVSAAGLYYDIIVSSPDETKLGDVEKSSLHVKYFCPLWTPEELQKVAEFHDLAPTEVSDRYDWCGGIPRLLFGKDWKTTIVEKCRGVKFTDLRDYFDTGFKGKLPMQLIHMLPTENMESFAYRFGSRQITRNMLEKIQQLNRRDVDWFVQGCRDMPFVQVLRGEILEKRWHGSLCEGGVFNCLSLGRTYRNDKYRTASKQRRSLAIPTLTVKEFSNVTSITSLDVNCYYQPTYRSFPTFDSFAVVSRNVIGDSTPASNGIVNVVLCFQMTVSRDHDLGVRGFQLMKELIDRLAPGMEMYVVFVSETDKLDTVQPISDGKKVASEDEPGWTVDQYVLHMDAPEDLLNMLFT